MLEVSCSGEEWGLLLLYSSEEIEPRWLVGEGPYNELCWLPTLCGGGGGNEGWY